jgi:hypothetical protein
MPISMDQSPNLPPDMIPSSMNQQQSPNFPMGDKTILLKSGMKVEEILLQLSPLSPQMGALINAFIPNFRRALAQSMPSPEEQGQGQPSPQASLMGGY